MKDQNTCTYPKCKCELPCLDRPVILPFDHNRNKDHNKEAEERAKEYYCYSENSFDTFEIINAKRTGFQKGYLDRQSEVDELKEVNQSLRDQIKQFEKVPGLKESKEHIAKLREALEQIKIHQINYVHLARTTQVWKIADQALNQTQ